MSISDASVVPVLAVEDLERATTFYRDKLGLDVQPSKDDPSGAIVTFNASNHIYLYVTSFPRGENTVAGIMVKDVRDTVRELKERGVAFEDYDLPGLKTEDGVATLGELQSAWFKDSEGNTIALTTEMTVGLEKAA
jgi:catechol 2,3-dioxygenase-like lactoylglutathione lyase family enzyme